ncbi:methylcobalamin:coenzyme M methyltransferase [Sedimentisphaera cyanobacteriorum]|uniref:Methylcobalamin:coenzyme M methyltransferase n=1 Tax=Sedimentisphaera cyanobacteriorum TaxID=1940790 RepID=A0A1Q2HMU2_9BACT|nr:uroporphyrinogen decarboxylase family protein [Sedimentisphaera cyanobacteriorum]AQQ08536.1 methylcobalamin:coenzyme M methyltransferase [Sedimentisphaera cyanobacteriorum]
MNSRERLQTVLEHKQPDRLCVDIGAGGQTGIGVCVLDKLRKTVTGDKDYTCKICETFQMLGEVDDELKRKLQLDVAGIYPLYDMFGLETGRYKKFKMPVDGTECLVPEDFNYTVSESGDVYVYPQGDKSAQPSAIMPSTSYFFDSIDRQKPVEEDKLNYLDNCEEFGVLSEKELNHFKEKVSWYYNNTEFGIYVTLPAMAFGDIALVPGPFLKDPKGIRGVEEWYISTAIRKDYIMKVFEKQCEVALENIELLADSLGDMPQVVFVTGTDFGAQRGPLISPETYREMYKPFQKAINDKIHKLTNWKVFMHCCGSIAPLIPDMIDAGFDVLNPVQCSAENMDPQMLKDEFGDDLVFWGGGVDTQKTLPFGTPEEVYKEVRERIDIFNEGGGYVFNSIHNIQSNVPLENLLSMINAVDDARGVKTI